MNPAPPPPPPPPGNRAPRASFTASPTSVPVGDNNVTIVTLDGSASSDRDGDSLTFSWTVPSGTFVNGTSATSVSPQVTFPGLAPYTVVLVVNDGRGGTDSASFTIQLS
ncbi:MAG: PKD domain-containing protein [Gemmatimonadota bacterium]